MDTQLKQMKDKLKSLSEMVLQLEKKIVEINESSNETINEIKRHFGTLYQKEQINDIEKKIDVLKTNVKELEYQIGLYETMKSSRRFSRFKIRSMIK